MSNPNKPLCFEDIEAIAQALNEVPKSNSETVEVIEQWLKSNRQELFTAEERDLAEKIRPKTEGVFFFEDLSLTAQDKYLQQARKQLQDGC